MHEPLLAWYAANARDLPWRRTRDPYAILVSEVMLQQTQVARVVPRYMEWLERWPTVEALAAATPADVILAWSGLGYNRRAVNLHRCAQAVVARGGFPREPGRAREAARDRAVHGRRGRLLRLRSPDRRARHERPARARAGVPGRATCSSRRAAPTSGTRRSSTSAARCASPARRAAKRLPARGRVPVPRADVRPAPAPVALRGLVPAAAGAASARDRRRRAASRGRGRRRGARLTRPRRARRGRRAARRGCRVRQAWRRAPPAPRARAARRRAHSRRAARARPG